MNSSTLRRLAADHAMLHSTELPPCYLFPASTADCSVDDLTQLTLLITGPNSTPYSQGLWKLCLKIPESYPKAPPKATFRTRIWHPNVEEKTGSVCVDTLKKDWQPNLTLRDVLITIYCLLIQPNPDSALNATAGHLLQDNYDSFARQARLMTSIHASIPSDARDAVLLAKRRGEIAGTAVGEDTEQRPMTKGKPASPSTRHPMRKLPECVTHEQSAPSTLHQALEDERPASEDEDDTSASKENDPLLSRAPVPVPVPSSRRPSMAKRPLSDLHIVKPEHDTIDATCSSPLEQSAVNNAIPSTSIATSYSSRKGLQLAEKSQSLNKTGHNNDNNGMCSDDFDGRATKRICSDFGKEDTLETRGARKLIETVLPTIGAASKVGGPSSRKASESSSSGISSVKGKARVGLRRL